MKCTSFINAAWGTVYILQSMQPENYRTNFSLLSYFPPSYTVPPPQNGEAKEAVKYQQFGHGRQQLNMIQCDKRHCDSAKPFLRALCKEDQQHYSFNSHVECNSQLGFVPNQGISIRSEGNILFTRLFPKALIFSSVWKLTFLFVRRPKELREWEKLSTLSWSWMALGGRSEKGCSDAQQDTLLGTSSQFIQASHTSVTSIPTQRQSSSHSL